METSNILRNILLVVVLLLAVLFGLSHFGVINKRLPQGMVLVHQASVDSLKAYIKIADSLEILANLPPDTIHLDTVYIDTSKVIITTPIPIPIDSTLVSYSDSIVVEDEISAWISFQVNGYLHGNINWRYIPIMKEVKIVVNQPVPYPVIEVIKVSEINRGHFLSIAIGGNDKMFTFGVDYDFIGKNNLIYGLQYRRYGEQNVYGAKVGINLNTIFKR